MTEITKTSKKSDFDAIAGSLLTVLDARSKDIIVRRYGIKTGKVETLESIGKEYGITRERVRQIESQAKKYIGKRRDVLEPVEKVMKEIFIKHGGIIEEGHLLEVVQDVLGEAVLPTLILFYLDILPTYKYVTGGERLVGYWEHVEAKKEYIEPVLVKAEEILKRETGPKKEAELILEIKKLVGENEELLSSDQIYALLRAAGQLKKTVFGEWALVEWVEASPRGVGDKAFIVLKRNDEPRHFRQITELINEANFDNKTAHAQTVHNELIKDDRFVLVGRGLYGLTEWGYIPGTVADVLQAILTKANQPMTKDELLAEVLEQRMVKKTTVLLGLQNNKRFQKVSGDKYSLANSS